MRGETLSLGKLNAGSEDTGYRASGTYVDQFANDKIGIAIGIAHMMSPTQIEKFNAWGYPADSNGVLGIGGVKPYVVSTELKRTGVIATIEFQPSENFNTRAGCVLHQVQGRSAVARCRVAVVVGRRDLAAGLHGHRRCRHQRHLHQRQRCDS